MRNATDNKNAYNYNKDINTHLTSICKPFMNAISTSTIAYHRIYSDGHGISICTNCEILEKYFAYVKKKGLFFQKHLKALPNKKQYYFLWPNKIENEIQEIMLEMGIWNGFNVYIKSEDYIETYVLMGTIKNTEVQGYCINNLDLVNCFISYFKDKTRDIIYSIDKNNMAYFNISSDWKNTSLKDQVYPNLHLNKVPLYINNEITYLTNREAICLSMFASGYSIKEISYKLKISPRTVEIYIANVKRKTRIQYRSSFIKLVQAPDNALIKNFQDNIIADTK